MIAALPNDPALPHLGTVADPDAMQVELSRATGDDGFTLQGIHLVRHKPGRRAILRYDVETVCGRSVLYAKTFASERGPKVYAITTTIVKAAAFGPDIALPAPVAYLPYLRTIVQRGVPGEPVADRLAANDTALAARIADALYRFNTSGIDLGRRHDLRKELSPLAARVEQVVQRDAALGDLARTLLDRLAAADQDELAWRWLPVHRDMYHEQVLVDGDRLAVLDLDDAAMSEPAVDVSNVVAHLMLLGAQRGSGVQDLQPVIDAFLGRAHALDPSLDPGLVAFLVASTLVRLSGIHVGRDHGVAIAHDLLHAANRYISGGGCTMP